MTKLICVAFFAVSFSVAAHAAELVPVLPADDACESLSEARTLAFPQLSFDQRNRFHDSDQEAFQEFMRWARRTQPSMGDAERFSAWLVRAARKVPLVLLSLQVPETMQLPFLPLRAGYSRGEAFMPALLLNLSLSWLFDMPASAIYTLNDHKRFLDKATIKLSSSSLNAVTTLGALPNHTLMLEMVPYTLWTILSAEPNRFLRVDEFAPSVKQIKAAAAKALFGSYWLITNSQQVQDLLFKSLSLDATWNGSVASLAWQLRGLHNIFNNYVAIGGGFSDRQKKLMVDAVIRIFKETIPGDLDGAREISKLQKEAWESAFEFMTKFLFQSGYRKNTSAIGVLVSRERNGKMVLLPHADSARQKRDLPSYLASHDQRWVDTFELRSREELSQELGCAILEEDYEALVEGAFRLLHVFSKSKIKLANPVYFPKGHMVLQSDWKVVRSENENDLREARRTFNYLWGVYFKKNGDMHRYLVITLNPEARSFDVIYRGPRLE